MTTEESSNTTHTTYIKREEKNYWGVYWLRIANYSMSQISKTVGLPVSSVQTIINRIKEKGTPLPEKQNGAPKKLDARDVRRLQAITRREPFASYDKINSELKLHNIHISRPTLINYLKDFGFGSYFATYKPELTGIQKLRRLRWAKERVNWTMDQWKGVVWLDGSRFTVEEYDGGARVLPNFGEKYKKEHTAEQTQRVKGSTMIWSFFWAGGFGPLVSIDSNVDQTTYKDILASRILPWFVNLCEKEDRDFILQEEDAICLTGGYKTWWEGNTHLVRRFDHWPAQSPDLNPVEHIWSSLQSLISDKRDRINSVDELKVALEEARKEISVDLAGRLVGSMKDRCQAVIDAKGGPTKF